MKCAACAGYAGAGCLYAKGRPEAFGDTCMALKGRPGKEETPFGDTCMALKGRPGKEETTWRR